MMAEKKKHSEILRVEDLDISLKVSKKEEIQIVKGASFSLREERILGLIGESGCGKSLTSLALMGLLGRDLWEVEGKVLLKEKDVLKLGQDSVRALRGKDMAIIMQNPMSSFNPLFTIGEHFAESIRSHMDSSRKDDYKIAAEMLEKVGLAHPGRILRQYPFQLSGGMLQRVMLAIGMFLQPSILIADEPTTSLDVTVQYQILLELQKLRSHYGTSMLFVSHDLGVISHMADEVAVMYYGHIIEQAPVKELFGRPVHPYTQGLMSSKPAFSKNRLKAIEGYPPSLKKELAGCPFIERCFCKISGCENYDMKSSPVSPGHTVRCMRYTQSHEVEEYAHA